MMLSYIHMLYILLLFSGWIQKDSGATDYSDITELAEEEEEKYYKHAVSMFSQKKNTSSAGKLQIVINLEILLETSVNS